MMYLFFPRTVVLARTTKHNQAHMCPAGNFTISRINRENTGKIGNLRDFTGKVGIRREESGNFWKARVKSGKVGKLRDFRAKIGYELGTSHASSWAPLMLRVGHLWCSSWAPLMPHLSCLELGTFDASSRAPLMPRVAPLMPQVGHLMLRLGASHAWVGHLSCLELGTFDSSSWALALSWAPLGVGHLPWAVGHLACLELGSLDASSWTPLMPGVGFLPAVGHLMHQSILLFSLELGTSDASGVAFLSSLTSVTTRSAQVSPHLHTGGSRSLPKSLQHWRCTDEQPKQLSLSALTSSGRSGPVFQPATTDTKSERGCEPDTAHTPDSTSLSNCRKINKDQQKENATCQIIAPTLKCFAFAASFMRGPAHQLILGQNSAHMKSRVSAINKGQFGGVVGIWPSIQFPASQSFQQHRQVISCFEPNTEGPESFLEFPDFSWCLAAGTPPRLPTSTLVFLWYTSLAFAHP